MNFENKINLYSNLFVINSSNDEKKILYPEIKKRMKKLFFSIYQNMCIEKCKIDNKNIKKYWDKAKRATNPYEDVNVLGTNILVKNNIYHDNKYYKYSVNPLSRAFFKMIEISNRINIIPVEYQHKKGFIANIAEGPGGFIEAIYKKRSINKIYDTFHGITLKSKGKYIPGWSHFYKRRKKFINKNIFNLMTGSIYNINTIKEYISNFNKKKAWLVTCDGGFDCSKDFNNQEKNSRKIIYTEIAICLSIQEKNGSMICKMFDLFTLFSVQLVYFITTLYKKVYIIKPVTSRPANSEKYIVATGFKGENKKLTYCMFQHIKYWDIKYNNLKNEEDLYFSNINIPEYFIQKMKKMNISLVNKQKKYINLTVNHIQHKKKTLNHKKYSRLWFYKNGIYFK